MSSFPAGYSCEQNWWARSAGATAIGVFWRAGHLQELVMGQGVLARWFPSGAGELAGTGGKGERRIGAFDGIRGWAVMMVIVTHCHWDWPGWGSAGVDMFFVLSGFLITALLLDEREKTGRVSLKNFYARRGLRLLPALLVVILCFVVGGMVLVLRVPRLPMKQVLEESGLALFYAANWARAYGFQTSYLSHTWSLSIEEQFYFIWPAMVLGIYWVLGRTKKAALLCLLGAIGLMQWRGWMLTHTKYPLRVYCGLETHGDGLLYGAMVAFFMPRVGRWWAVILGWTCAVGVVAFLFVPGMKQELLLMYTVGLLISIVNSPAGLLTRMLSFSPIVWVGKISYGLYLYHFPIMLYMWMVKRWHPLEITLVGVPLSLGVAAASYYGIERPCLRLKSRFRSKGAVVKVEAGREGEVLRADAVTAEA